MGIKTDKIIELINELTTGCYNKYYEDSKGVESFTRKQTEELCTITAAATFLENIAEGLESCLEKLEESLTEKQSTEQETGE